MNRAFCPGEDEEAKQHVLVAVVSDDKLAEHRDRERATDRRAHSQCQPGDHRVEPFGRWRGKQADEGINRQDANPGADALGSRAWLIIFLYYQPGLDFFVSRRVFALLIPLGGLFG